MFSSGPESICRGMEYSSGILLRESFTAKPILVETTIGIFSATKELKPHCLYLTETRKCGKIIEEPALQPTCRYDLMKEGKSWLYADSIVKDVVLQNSTTMSFEDAYDIVKESLEGRDGEKGDKKDCFRTSMNEKLISLADEVPKIKQLLEKGKNLIDEIEMGYIDWMTFFLIAAVALSKTNVPLEILGGTIPETIEKINDKYLK